MLKQRALSAVLWSGTDILMRQGLQFFVSIALARLLSPEEFGTIALLSLFIGIASAFVDCGFSSALVQHQGVTHNDESTVFWFNLAMGSMVGLCLWVLSPVIAGIFSLPILIPLTSLFAINIFLTSLGSIHGTLLTKRLEFRTQMQVGVYATVISGIVAVVMAWYDYGVWALAAQTLVATCVSTSLLWYFHRWRPAFVFSIESARRLFGFGGYMLASGLLEITYDRMYTLLIGKYFGVRELGFYNRADSTKQLPVSILTGILSRVAFPIFSAAAHDINQLRRGVQLVVRCVMLLNVPMMLGLAAVAKPLILVLFGPVWLPVVPVMQVLCLAGIFWPLHVINLNVLLAQGYSHLFFRLEVVKKLLGVLLLAVGVFYGVMGIAWSQVIFGALAFLINGYYTKKYLGYGAVAQLIDFSLILFITLPTILGIYWLSEYIQLAPVLKLIGLSALGALIILMLAWLFNLAAINDVVDLFLRRKVVVHSEANALK